MIDYLKIDIEESEWLAFPSMFVDEDLNTVKQLAFEIHMGKNPSKDKYMWIYMQMLALRILGFRRFHSHENPFSEYTSIYTNEKRRSCFELYYINTNFLIS